MLDYNKYKSLSDLLMQQLLEAVEESIVLSFLATYVRFQEWLYMATLVL